MHIEIGERMASKGVLGKGIYLELGELPYFVQMEL